MNVVVLTPGFAASKADTTCIPVLQSLMFALHQQHSANINIQIVSFQYPFTKGSYDWNGISCWSAGGSNRKFPARWKTWYSVIRFLKRFHKKKPIDIIHAFWLTECTLVGKWAAGITGAKLICHAMGQDVLPSNRYMKHIHPSSLNILTISEYAARQLQKNFGIKDALAVPMGLNIDDFKGLQFNEERHTDILGVGSLIPLKNYRLFVSLFAQLAKEFPGLTGRIIGDGVEKESLMKLIHESGLQEQLLLEGKLDRRDVLQMMTHSRILLHPSQFESAGYVFLEALYAGMKVVGFDTGFLPDLPEADICNNEDEMLNTLRKLLAHKHSHRQVMVHSIQDTANTVFDYYKKVI